MKIVLGSVVAGAADSNRDVFTPPMVLFLGDVALLDDVGDLAPALEVPRAEYEVVAADVEVAFFSGIEPSVDVVDAGAPEVVSRKEPFCA